MTVNVTMLGGFSLQVGERALSDEVNRSQKLWSVLCYLIAHRDRAVPQSELIALFWQEENRANPGNALKTLLYRVRALLEPLFGGVAEPILSRRGAYIWNPAITCAVDAERFETLCRAASSPALSTEERLKRYQEATELYRGDYLPKLEHQMWVVPISAHYHAIYLEAVKCCAQLLSDGQEYSAMAALCSRASALDGLDEGLHILRIRALLRQGREAAALAHYEKATDLLYRSLGVRPSADMRALYTEIMATEKSMETDLEVIQSSLKEAAARPGAFVCEYGFFQEAYRLEARRALRSGTCVHVALLTVAQPDGGVPPLGVLTATMEQLLAVLVASLRRGDVVARYSSAQYVILLPAANYEDSTMVMERVTAAFYRQHRRNYLKLSCKIRELELS